eukprot:CAMPEP_0180578786 /NCGR_PEP_ID=MMETSP1037_2-20121125/12646_1 /TAXON_ID=632150 /ORGANISM="Azadinium spinosum, Strain 3D9" /LENGTH=104 /DNA_ID=CAMNT_0022596609 /DNA_START=306 /DNA_END=624 /DNA_ORIENTATION=+
MAVRESNGRFQAVQDRALLTGLQRILRERGQWQLPAAAVGAVDGRCSCTLLGRARSEAATNLRGQVMAMRVEVRARGSVALPALMARNQDSMLGQRPPRTRNPL